MLQRPSWPPDYDLIARERAARLRILHQDPRAASAAREFYASSVEGCVAFIEDWCETFDPRNAGGDRPTTMPFMPFSRQRELIEFLYSCFVEQAPGLIEKSRDMGATWLCVSFSVWLFLFVEGAKVGWGSRKVSLVDKIGDMDSIFEKIRFQMRSIPRIFWPPGFGEDHMSFMKIWSPDGSSITGEGGDDIGRGGRTLIYFKDESAHYEHPEAIEAALSDNTRVQIDISSVNGLGNVFHRKREAGIEWTPDRAAERGKTNVFVMNWTEHPDKSQSWYEERQNHFEEQGLLHIFRQEVDRNYSAAVVGVIIPAEWVQSAIDAHVTLGIEVEDGDECFGGLDVADEGGDTNALVVRESVVLRHLEQWGARDTGVTARKAIDGIAPYARRRRRAHLQYDSIGVGAGIKSEANRLADEDLMPKYVELASWNAGAAVVAPDDRVIEDDDESPLNKDFYANLKAQGWWQLRLRFERTHRAVLRKNGDPEQRNFTWRPEELISLPSDLPLLRTLQKELSQPVVIKSPKMRLIVDKKPPGTKSPNLADAVVMCFWPVDALGYDTSMDWVK